MGHVQRVVVIGLAGALGGCGETFEDPFVALVRVSGETPFADGCAGPPQGEARVFPSIEVEPSLAVDPTNPQHLVGAWQQDRWSSGGANGIGVGASFDGGATWSTTEPRLGRCSGGDDAYIRATDPWVTIGADGTAYLFALVYDPFSSRNAMVASRSNDGGRSWGEPAVVRLDEDPDVFNDKNSITADPVDPGRVYAVWDRLIGLTDPDSPRATGPTWFARTTDGVWEPARAIYEPGTNAQTIGNYVVVLPNGTLVNVFNLITNVSGGARSEVAVIRSMDKGLSWSDATVIAPMRGRGVQDPYNHVFIRSGTSLPQIAVDRSTGVLYIAWEDYIDATGVDGAVLVSSVDGGLTWSAPRQINGAPEAAFTPNIAVAADGTVGVMYYDLRNVRPADADAFRVTPWLATSRDGGVVWDDEQLSEPFDLRPARLQNTYFLGDYQGLGAAGNTFVPFFVGANAHSDDKTNVYVRVAR